jgi:hypothetical protein
MLFIINTASCIVFMRADARVFLPLIIIYLVIFFLFFSRFTYEKFADYIAVISITKTQKILVRLRDENIEIESLSR